MESFGKISRLFFVVVLTALCNTSCTQGIEASKLDAYFSVLETNHKIMGSVAAAKDGKIVYQRTVGYADVESGKKANTRTKYRIGSISKTFTAVLVMKAVEARLLSLSQTINRWFPAVRNADKITIEQLLNHSSGIHSFTDNADYMTWNTKAKSEAEMLALIVMGGSDFEPGTKSVYSNANYVLLTLLLEKIFEKSFAEILRAEITQPLSLADTYVGGAVQINNNEAYSYQWKGAWERQSETDLSIPLGAGAIVSTPTDIVLFASALFNDRIIKRESLEKMKQINNGYGFGLVSFPFYEKTCYGHTGGIDGFRSVFCFLYDGKTAYALTANGVNINPNDISIAVLSALYNKPYALPVFSTYTIDEKDLAQYIGTYVSDQIALKISISKIGNALSGQATGQAAFPLEAVGKHTFTFEGAGIEMIFNPGSRTMVLKQGGGQFNFKMEQ